MDMAWRQSQNYLNHQNHCSEIQTLDIVCVRLDQERKYATVTALATKHVLVQTETALARSSALARSDQGSVAPPSSDS